MTIPVSQRRAGPYPGTGSQTAFDFGFKVFDETDLRVVLLDVPTNVETESVLNSDYTVSINPDQESTPGGTVNYLAAPAATKKVTIVGDLSYEQPTDLPDGGAYRAQQVENGLDRIVILLQQLKEITDRCAQVPVSSTDAESLFESINVLSANLPTLQTVVANIADLVALAGSVADVNALAAISAQIQTVAAIAAQVVAVAAISPEIVTVEGISAEVVTVATNMAAILAAVADLPALAGKANSGDVTTSLLTTNTATILGRLTAGNGALEKLTAAQVVSLLRASTGQAQGGADNDTLLTPLRLKEAQIQLAAAVTLTNQTQVDFTAIPSWVKRVTVLLSAASTSGTSLPLVQLGTSGGIQATGYVASAVSATGTPVVGNSTAGFPLIGQGSAGATFHAALRVERMDATRWVARLGGVSGSGTPLAGGGGVTLGGALDRVRLTTVNGTDQYDAGAVAISLE